MVKIPISSEEKNKGDNPAYRLTAGARSLESRAFQKAIDIFVSILRDEPENGNAYLNLGKAYVQMGRMQEAVNALLKAAELLPGNVEAYLLLSQAYAGTGSHDDALMTLRKAESLFPDEPYVPFKLGMLLGEMDRLNESAEAYSKAVTIKPEFAQAHNNLGALYVNCGLYLMGVKTLEKAVEFDPQNPICRDNYGRALAGLRKFDLAIAQQLESIRLNPGRAATHRHIADTYFKMGNRELALKAIRKAVELNSDDPANCLGLSEVLTDQFEDQAEGLKLCKTWLKKWPEDIDVISRVAMIYTASRATYGGKDTLNINGIEKAEELLEQALKKAPDNVRLHKQMVLTIQNRGWGGEYTERALRHLSEVVRIRPDDPQAHFELGECYYSARGNVNIYSPDIECLQLAEQSLRKAIRLDPCMLDAYECLAKTYEALGWDALAQDTRKQAESVKNRE